MWFEKVIANDILANLYSVNEKLLLRVIDFATD